LRKILNSAVFRRRIFGDPRGEGGEQAFACGGNPGEKIGLGPFSDHGVTRAEIRKLIGMVLIPFGEQRDARFGA
jgi:hypothetical protein